MNIPTTADHAAERSNTNKAFLKNVESIQPKWLEAIE
jgi:hypothetical protein